MIIGYMAPREIFDRPWAHTMDGVYEFWKGIPCPGMTLQGRVTNELASFESPSERHNKKRIAYMYVCLRSKPSSRK